ncbi:MAG: hypothetical protein GXP24_08720 [Planctomycetes bacterium]|nr:hypothetical protein [Planctomycetota bacterium]
MKDTPLNIKDPIPLLDAILEEHRRVHTGALNDYRLKPVPRCLLQNRLGFVDGWHDPWGIDAVPLL